MRVTRDFGPLLHRCVIRKPISLSWRSVFVRVYLTHPLPYYYVLHL